MKRILFHAIVVCLAAALGLAAGFFLRGKHAAHVTAEGLEKTMAPALRDSPVTSSRVSKSSAGPGLRDDSSVAAKLERDLSMSSGVTRWLYWFEALENASASDFPRLHRMAEGNAAASRLVSQRWIELHPRHLFDTLVQAGQENGMNRGLIDLSYTLFRDWPKRDLEGAIGALSGPDAFAMRGGLRLTLAGAVIETDVERGLRLFSEWHIGNYGPRMSAVAKWAAADPRHAAEFALANPAGYATRLTMETIGKEWAKTDPARALEFAAANPGEFGTILSMTTLKEWAAGNLDAAANWLAAADPSARNRLSAAFVESWAKQDADSALAWCESNLTGTSLVQAVGGVLQGAAGKDISAAAALVTSLKPSPARAEAAVAVAKKWISHSLDPKPVPTEALAWLADLDSDSAQRVLRDVDLEWASSDPKSMAAFLVSSGERFHSDVYETLAREMARKDPVGTLEWAGQLADGCGSSAGAMAFSQWRQTQPEAATKWLNALPHSDSRRDLYFRRAIRTLAWDVQSSEQLASLTASERSIAREVIKDMSLSEDRRNALLKILK